jgi:hypothetical protein
MAFPFGVSEVRKFGSSGWFDAVNIAGDASRAGRAARH